MENKAHAFTVVSPEYEAYSFDGINPPEYGRDVVELECKRSEAKALALRTPEFKKWVQEARENGENPLKGLEVIPTICDHGKCFCWHCITSTPCKECELEAQGK